MKKLIFTTLLLVCGLTMAMAQKPAQIKFDKTTHDFGSFSEKNPKVTCTFTYTNVGNSLWLLTRALLRADAQYLSTPKHLSSQARQVKLR